MGTPTELHRVSSTRICRDGSQFPYAIVFCEMGIVLLEIDGKAVEIQPEFGPIQPVLHVARLHARRNLTAEQIQRSLQEETERWEAHLTEEVVIVPPAGIETRINGR